MRHRLLVLLTVALHGLMPVAAYDVSLEEILIASIYRDAPEGFIVEKGAGEFTFQPAPEDTFKDAMSYAIATWQTSAEQNGDVPLFADLDDYIAAAIGGFTFNVTGYDIERELFTGTISTGSGLFVIDVEMFAQKPFRERVAESLKDTDVLGAFVRMEEEDVLTLARFAIVTKDPETQNDTNISIVSIRPQTFGLPKRDQ